MGLAGMSSTTAINWFFNFVLSITFPSLLGSFGHTGTFIYYSVWCVIGWWLILLYVPETRNCTLEELDARFSVPAKMHARQSLNELRYWIKFYVMRYKEARKPQLNVEYREPDVVRPKLEFRMFQFDDGHGRPRLTSIA